MSPNAAATPRPRRLGTALALLMLTAPSLAACSSATEGQLPPDEVACPAIGWFNTLEVTLEGESNAVADVKLCVGEDCYPKEAPSGDGSDLAEAAGMEQRGSTTSWIFSPVHHVDEVTVRTYDVEGTVLTDDLVEPRWLRTGGSEECGGPHFGEVAIRL